MNILKTIWGKWIHIGKIIGDFQARIFLTVFYFALLWIVGIIVRFFSDPLRLHKTIVSTNFSPWMHPQETREQARKQY